MRRPLLCAAAPACLLLGLSPIAAHADAAPIGSATATAAQVGSLIGVSSTGASASPSTADAQANVITLAGQPLLGLGGSQGSEGETHGALLDTGTSLPAHVEVAPWHAAATGSTASSRRSSTASAAVARAELPSVVKAGVLTSESQAEHRSEQSTGSSVSDGVDLGLADIIQLVLLHSETSSSGRGSSYLVGLNGTEIGSDEQLGDVCALDVTGVASLACLTASGGIGNNGLTSGAAELLGVQTALGLDPVAAFSTSASSGPGTADILPAVADAAAPATVAAAEATRTVSPDASSAGLAALPRTGVAVASLAASALAALLGGLALRLFGRRRATA